MKEVLMEVGFLNLLMVITIETAKKSDHFLCFAFGLDWYKFAWLLSFVLEAIYPKERKWIDPIKIWINQKFPKV